MLVDSLNEIIAELQETLEDAAKADSGNKSAGVRVRKDASNAVDALKALRKLVLEMRTS